MTKFSLQTGEKVHKSRWSEDDKPSDGVNDSDLHLQLDKESFLSAKPLTEGAFGYAWAGVRGTHGASSGKVCYEVKLIEELKWEDISKHDQRGRDRYRTDHRKNQKRDKDKKDFDKKSTEKPKTENIENKDETPADKTAEEEEVLQTRLKVQRKWMKTQQNQQPRILKSLMKNQWKPMKSQQKNQKVTRKK
ncbi:hypothetical protein NQ318_008505 [Aromia moschata]|uniref:Uncharacterized protein n=1 Tax=Aromia moschata TaxID=1265417 RepID=A0AAV8X6Y3_9CUCU|nr:hypothetical protein NQ318_008505 [Aromia moschata]